MCCFNRTQARSGFTLIELLVVIAIIAILAAILFPVLLSAKRAAQSATCCSNMRQVWTAVSQYANDNNSKFPPVVRNFTKFLDKKYENDPDPEKDLSWPMIIGKYSGCKINIDPGHHPLHNPVNPWRIMRCPIDNADPMKIWTQGAQCPDGKPGTYGWYGNWGLCSSPGMNFEYLSPVTNPVQIGSVVHYIPDPVSISAAVNPSKTVAFCESKYMTTEQPVSYGYFIVEPPTNDTVKSWWRYGGWANIDSPPGWVGQRHNGKANVLWVDGHLKAMSIGSLRDPSLWDLE